MKSRFPAYPNIVSIGIVLVIGLVALPWTAHAYDAAAFLSHADRVYFAHVAPTRLWPYGSILLGALLLSQLPILLFPQLWDVVPVRLALLKLPAWLADAGSALVIRASSSDRRLANAWALRYLLDPIVVFVTIFHGQSDAIPNLFAVAGIAAMVSDRYELAALALGLGVGAKFYPAAFAPILVVAALRRGTWRRAASAVGIFVITGAAGLLPVMLGRSGSVVAAWTNNSFGPEGHRVATASLWGLLPAAWNSAALAPQVEQAVAVAIPVALALFELRHIPSRRDLARVAMFSAMSAVLLNPGAHPPFFLWIAGPLVLYCAISSNGVVSLAGVLLSSLGILTQFCQEPAGEYFRLVFGSVNEPGLLRCLTPFGVLQDLMLAVCATIVAGAYGSAYFTVETMSLRRRNAQWAALVICGLLGFAAVAEAALAHRPQADPTAAFRNEEAHVNTFAIFPLVTRRSDGTCLLTYDANDLIVFAGNPFAARFGSAYLRYTSYSPTEMTVGGRTASLDGLPRTFVRAQIFTGGSPTFDVERQFDVSDLLRPFRYVERFVERPCNVVRGNPVLIYRFDIPAARAAALHENVRDSWKFHR